jgi:short subunit dehydrogenase-like uncharacterized protein
MPPIDIILWGATGFTGQLVAQSISQHAPAGLKWAIGGRDLHRLERVNRSLREPVEVVIADSLDLPSLTRMVQKARVIISTVGPFEHFGTPLVEACVEQGVDYCDITGEAVWIRTMIDRFHTKAQKSGARIVHACGFDSIPSDIGVFALHRFMLDTTDKPLDRAKLYVLNLRGKPSGGTAASLLNHLQAMQDQDVRQIVNDPYSLNPQGQRQGSDSGEQTIAHFDPVINQWTAPFIMAGINSKIVRRSNALLDNPYGKEFRYTEVSACSSFAKAQSLSLALRILGKWGHLRAFDYVLKEILPRPGQGPTPAQRQQGGFHFRLVGHTKGKNPQAAFCDIKGSIDPGYDETAKMLSQTAFCLAFDKIDAPGGILTPASACGAKLIPRITGKTLALNFGKLPYRAIKYG